nr:hypothetical protein Iba_chr11bCG12320 [Ipomoea batatas]
MTPLLEVASKPHLIFLKAETGFNLEGRLEPAIWRCGGWPGEAVMLAIGLAPITKGAGGQRVAKEGVGTRAEAKARPTLDEDRLYCPSISHVNPAVSSSQAGFLVSEKKEESRQLGNQKRIKEESGRKGKEELGKPITENGMNPNKTTDKWAEMYPLSGQDDAEAPPLGKGLRWQFKRSRVNGNREVESKVGNAGVRSKSGRVMGNRNTSTEESPMQEEDRISGLTSRKRASE